MTEDLEKYEARQPAVIQPDGKSLLELVIEKGADLQTIEKFMDLQERHEKREARKLYVVAMTAFKENPPEILKQTSVSYEKKDGTITAYKHPSLDHVSEQINTALSKHGLFAAWSQSQSESGITVTCKITHEGGHQEETSLTASADTSGGKNAIQGLGSTISYLQRYTILAITGLAAKGMDNDGRLPEEEAEPITKEQVEEIDKLLEYTKTDMDKFHIYLTNTYKTPGYKDLNTNNANGLITTLKAKLEQQKKDAK